METKFNVTAYHPAKYQEFGSGMAVEAGKMIAEAFKKKGQERILKERFGITFKEDVTTTVASGAYTTMLSTTLYAAAISNIKEVLELVNVNEDLLNKGGFGAYKIPRLQPTTAIVVAEGAVVTYFDEGVDSITVTPQKVVAGTAITWEILKRGMTDFAKFVLQNAADAVSRKLASDIVNGLAAGAGFTVATVSYANITTQQSAVEGATDVNSVPYGFLCDKLVIASASWATFLQDTDIKGVLYRVGGKPGDMVDITVGPGRMAFGNMEVVKTPFLTSAKALILDSRKCAMLVKESNLETFEGAIPGRPYDREIVALMSYALAILYPKACARIT